MEIKISEEEIRHIVQEESDKAIRKRVREMQGDYTSKGYLENMMRDIIWDTIMYKIPDLESFVKDCVREAVNVKKQEMKLPSKSEIIDAVIEALEGN